MKEVRKKMGQEESRRRWRRGKKKACEKASRVERREEGQTE